MPALFGNGGQAPLLPSNYLTASSSYTVNPPFNLPTTTAAQILRTTDTFKVERLSATHTILRSGSPEIDSAPRSFPNQVFEEQLIVTTTETVTAKSGSPSHKQPMKSSTARAAVWSTALGALSFFGLVHHFRFDPAFGTENAEHKSWVATSSSWLDRAACNWIGICGASHLQKSKLTSKSGINELWRKKPLDATKYWTSGAEDESTWSPEEQRLRQIPDYVLDHAPYVHLYSGEEFWPCDIAEHLVHTTPHVNYDPVEDELRYPNLESLEDLNSYGKEIFLQSDDNVEDFPDWLSGEANIPSGSPLNHRYQRQPDYYRGNKGWLLRTDKNVLAENDENRKWVKAADDALPTSEEFRTARNLASEIHSEESDSAGGRSDAPAILIVVDKGDDVVDAFWFYFYSYNLGNTFFSVRFGNHVGDWEHTAIRFFKGKPKLVYFSEHSWGEAYSWEAVEKIGKRPVSYSASGTHAMYGSPGTHEYVLPFGLLFDVTDRGPLWDPKMNMHSYTYDYRNDTIRSSQLNPRAPTGWFYFLGHWGDKFYPLSDPRQYRFAGQYHYVNGPLGPRYKRLNRKHICEGLEDEPCDIRTTVNKRVGTWKPQGEGEDLRPEDEAWAMKHEELRRHEYIPIPTQPQR